MTCPGEDENYATVVTAMTHMVMDRRDLERVCLKRSQLGVTFHLRDLLGRYDTTVSTALRLAWLPDTRYPQQPCCFA